jgi:hypothetical protein
MNLLVMSFVAMAFDDLMNAIPLLCLSIHVMLMMMAKMMCACVSVAVFVCFD